MIKLIRFEMKKLIKSKMLIIVGVAIIGIIIAMVAGSLSSVFSYEENGAELSGFDAIEIDNESEILGALSHSPTEIKIDENSNGLPFEYNGGEFELKYEVMAEGKAKNLGFLIFVHPAFTAHKSTKSTK